MHLLRFMLVLSLTVFLLLEYVLSIKREFKFDKVKACEQTYGTVLKTKTNVVSYLSCITICTDDTRCASCSYHPSSKTCKTNNDTWLNPSTSNCTWNVYYGSKQSIEAFKSYPTECVKGSNCITPILNVRLCDGGGPGICNQTRGRLEVFYNDTWGTVCDDNWYSYDYYFEYYGESFNETDTNAPVTCRMLGFTNGVSHQAAYFGSGVDPIWLDGIQCIGNETSVFDCQKQPWGLNDCNHFEDISVTCA